MINLLELNKSELKTWFLTDNKSGYKTTEKWLKKHHYSLYIKIINNNSEQISFKEKVLLYLLNLKETPKCPVCGKSVKFKGSISKGFSNTCSIVCSNKHSEVLEKKREIYQSAKFKELKKKSIEKTKQTKLEKYGDKNYNNQKKCKETNLNKYGVICVFQNEKIKKRIKETNLRKYGVTHLSKDKNYQLNKAKKIKETSDFKFKKIIAKNLRISSDDIVIDGDHLIVSNYCQKHQEFKISKNNYQSRLRLNVNQCTECYPISDLRSISEREVLTYIRDSLNDQTIDKGCIENKEIDVFISNKNLAIEYDGLYWHSNKYVDKKYHLDKTELCEKQNIQLLHIFEDEWIFKRDIVKSIINNKLGVSHNKIYARKTEIREISDNKIVSDFLNNNHIQGFVGSKVKLGLYYKNELVSLMTFGSNRKSMGKESKENEYELLRFCNKLNTNVVGGASKLLKYFIKNYNPKKITTYADRRYSNGNLYTKLDFNLVTTTEPNYWYFKKNELKRYYRFNFRKDVLVKEGYDKNKTEKEIMLERGYLWIYDCGNYKYEMVL
jgi:hypothetical protein